MPPLTQPPVSPRPTRGARRLHISRHTRHTHRSVPARSCSSLALSRPQEPPLLRPRAYCVKKTGEYVDEKGDTYFTVDYEGTEYHVRVAVSAGSRRKVDDWAWGSHKLKTTVTKRMRRVDPDETLPRRRRVAAPAPSAPSQDSAYELQRKVNIADNEKMLRLLGILG